MMAATAEASPTFYTQSEAGLQERGVLSLVSPSYAAETLMNDWPGAPFRHTATAPHFVQHYSVLQPSADPEAQSALLRRARDVLAEIETAETADLSARFYHALDIVQALGEAEDEAVLVRLALERGFYQLTLKPAIGSALRRDALETGAAVLAWRDGLGDETFQAELTLALAEWGYGPAQERLIDLLAVERNGALLQGGILPAFDIVTREQHPAVTELVRDFLAAQSNWRQAGAASDEPVEFAGLFNTRAFNRAFLYGHAHFTGDDRALLSGPAARLASSQSVVPLLPFFADVRQGSNALFAISKGWQVAADQAFTTDPGIWMRDLCDLRTTADQTGTRTLWRDIEDTFTAWHVEHLTAPGADSDDRQHFLANWTRRQALLNCSPDSDTLSRIENEPIDAYRALPSYARAAASSSWHLFDPYSDQQSFQYIVLDELSDSTIAQMDDDPQISANPVWEEVLARRGVLSATHFGHQTRYPGEDDRRYFLDVTVESSATVYLGGLVEFRPRQTSSGTLFGIRLSVDPYIPETSALAAAIANIYEELEVMLADGALPLIQSVNLRRGSATRPLTHQQTAADGTQVFILEDAIEDMSNLVVDVELAFYNEVTTLSFPLYASPFGYQSLLNEGRIEVQSWQ